MFWDYQGVRLAVLGMTLRVREHCGVVRGQGIFESSPAYPTGDGGKRGGDEAPTLCGGLGRQSRRARQGAGQAKKKSSFQKEGVGQVSPVVP